MVRQQGQLVLMLWYLDVVVTSVPLHTAINIHYRPTGCKLIHCVTNFRRVESIIIFAQWKQTAECQLCSFQVKLKMIIALKVVIDFANHFRSAEYGTNCQVNLSKTN